MDTKQKLGIRVFYYYLYQRIIAGVILLIVSSVFNSMKEAIASKLSFVIPFVMTDMIVTYCSDALYILAIIVLIGGVIISWLDYISCSFTLDDFAFKITRGIFGKREISIPYRQIQDINIEQSFSNKMLGVSTLVVLTAGNDNDDKEGEAEGVFRVIDSRVAEQIRENILQKASIQTVKEVKA